VSIEQIIVGLLAIGIGLAWAFHGSKLFTILLPLWAFFFGFVLGAIALFWQMRNVGESISAIDRNAYQY
jgi:hypothetical protein